MVCVAVKGEPIIGIIHKPFSKITSWAWVGKQVSQDLEQNKVKVGLYYFVVLIIIITANRYFL